MITGKIRLGCTLCDLDDDFDGAAELPDDWADVHEIEQEPDSVLRPESFLKKFEPEGIRWPTGRFFRKVLTGSMLVPTGRFFRKVLTGSMLVLAGRFFRKV